MRKTTAFAILLTACSAAHAAETDEEKFRKCVELKDFVVLIAEKANQGFSRSDIKAKLTSRAADGVIDLVYDFRGAMTTQDMASRQMEQCLKVSGLAPKPR